MHHKIDELIKDAGFSDRNRSEAVDSLFGTEAQPESQQSPAPQETTHGISQFESSPQINTTQGNMEFNSSGTEATTQGGDPQTSSSGGLTSSLSGAASDLLGGGNFLEGLLGGGLLGDLFSGISGLFGGEHSQPAPLVQYSAPQSQDFELATEGGQVGDAVYNQQGDPRAVPASEPALSGLQYLGAAPNQASDSSAGGNSSASQSSPQITMNVQAMDSQSFLDRSQDIASAVRQAMLNMHSINDVINDL